jgi:hypothetical protein
VLWRVVRRSAWTCPYVGFRTSLYRLSIEDMERCDSRLSHVSLASLLESVLSSPSSCPHPWHTIRWQNESHGNAIYRCCLLSFCFLSPPVSLHSNVALYFTSKCLRKLPSGLYGKKGRSSRQNAFRLPRLPPLVSSTLIMVCFRKMFPSGSATFVLRCRQSSVESSVLADETGCP